MRLYLSKKHLLILGLLSCLCSIEGQNSIDIQGTLDPDNNTLSISQQISYYNNSETPLKELYFNDWNSSFSSPESPLSKRFVEEFNKALLNPKEKNRGYTTLHTVLNTAKEPLSYSYLKDQSDVLKIELNTALLPHSSISVFINYTVKVQSDKFTKYGLSKDGDYFLNHWYLTPAVFENGEWKLYSHKDLSDYYTPKSKLKLVLEVPKSYSVSSELDLSEIANTANTHKFKFLGNNRTDTRLNITRSPYFTFKAANLKLITNCLEADKSLSEKLEIFEKVIAFLDSKFEKYPHNNLLISKVDLDKNPIYGLNILPDFLSPFSEEFEFELTIAKNLICMYLDEYLDMNPREDHWLKSGFETILLMKYVEQYYEDERMLGKLADVWGIKSYNLAKLKYNDQYNLTYLHMVRTGRDQALNLPKDALLKFNANLASKYKAAKGLLFLEALIGDTKFEDWISEFVITNANDFKTTEDFKLYINSKTTIDIDWFFKSFLTNTQQVDYKITALKSSKDSIYFTVKNKKNGQSPIALFMLKDDKILSKQWLTNIGKQKEFVVANNLADKLVLNYDQKAPEFELRNNWKSVNGNPMFNKPFKLRLLKDYESPYNNQLCLIPTFEYRNIYDGINLGININNKGILSKRLTFGIAPNYSTVSKAITGFTKFEHNSYFEDKNLYNIKFGAYVSRASFSENSFVTKSLPFFMFNFKNASDLRSNSFKRLSFRYVGIEKKSSQQLDNRLGQPSYQVFNIRYLESDPGFKKFYSWFLDAQLSNQFGKIAINYEVRKRTNNNSFYALRMYAGAFVYSKINSNQTYFNFALDRPTDYLFDYNYLGQFESSGIFSQQIIVAEGGFKSKLDTPSANQWLTTLNASASIWKYIQAYGDIGVVKNKGDSAKFVYDSGVRLNLITDYFEIYFPFYSNLGWELNDPQYSQKIRFVFTANPADLFGLFRREWY